jgi:hypothetical protein
MVSAKLFDNLHKMHDFCDNKMLRLPPGQGFSIYSLGKRQISDHDTVLADSSTEHTKAPCFHCSPLNSGDSFQRLDVVR